MVTYNGKQYNFFPYGQVKIDAEKGDLLAVDIQAVGGAVGQVDNAAGLQQKAAAGIGIGAAAFQNIEKAIGAPSAHLQGAVTGLLVENVDAGKLKIVLPKLPEAENHGHAPPVTSLIIAARS